MQELVKKISENQRPRLVIGCLELYMALGEDMRLRIFDPQLSVDGKKSWEGSSNLIQDGSLTVIFDRSHPEVIAGKKMLGEILYATDRLQLKFSLAHQLNIPFDWDDDFLLEMIKNSFHYKIIHRFMENPQLSELQKEFIISFLTEHSQIKKEIKKV